MEVSIDETKVKEWMNEFWFPYTIPLENTFYYDTDGNSKQVSGGNIWLVSRRAKEREFD